MLRPTPAALRALEIGIAVLQVLDILLHAATHQLEPLRVTSNLIVLAWLAVVAAGKLNTKFLPLAACAIGAYGVLNIIFLAQEGVTNPAQGGEPRVMLFALVFLTLALSILLAAQAGRRFTQ